MLKIISPYIVHRYCNPRPPTHPPQILSLCVASACARVHTHTHTHTRARARAHTLSLSPSFHHTHTRTHAHTFSLSPSLHRTHARSHAHTHIHKPTQVKTKQITTKRTLFTKILTSGSQSRLALPHFVIKARTWSNNGQGCWAGTASCEPAFGGYPSPDDGRRARDGPPSWRIPGVDSATPRPPGTDIPGTHGHDVRIKIRLFIDPVQVCKELYLCMCNIAWTWAVGRQTQQQEHRHNNI